MRKLFIWIVLLLIVAVAVWYTLPKRAPQQQSNSATSTVQIPGDNLTLGQTASAGVGTYLVAYNGMTLYTYALDATNVSNCTGGCAVAWPPYLVTSTKNLVAEYPLKGMIGTITRGDGSTQITYNGRPLYFFKGDTAPNQVNGQGIGGVWYAAKP